MARLGDLFPDNLQPVAPPKPAPRPLPPRPAPQNQNRQNNPNATPLLSQGAAQALKRAERAFIKELISGQEIEGVFLVAEATMRAAKNGSKYVQATFLDKTGSIPVRQWDARDDDFSCYKVAGYIRARGRVETYKNAMQMIVFSVDECDGAGINPSDFLPVSVRPLDEMERELDTLLTTFTDPDYKALLTTIFSDQTVRGKFLVGPAAASVHHAWRGGLIEHVLSACKTGQSIAEQRPFLNRDLLMAGVILHDIGKIEEIDAGPGFSYTDTGRLCGHIVLGTLLVDRFIRTIPEFPKKKRDLILHMILSHHGELEYGSPVMPMTAEAVALHHLECMDAKVQGIQSIIEKERSLGNDSTWSDFARVVDGRIYKESGPSK